LGNVHRTCAVSDESENFNVASSVVAVLLPRTAVAAARALPTVNIVSTCRSSTWPVRFSTTAYEYGAAPTSTRSVEDSRTAFAAAGGCAAPRARMPRHTAPMMTNSM
jgi:hypothetical protein